MGLIADLQGVLDEVHSKFVYVSDQAKYGRSEYWKAIDLNDPGRQAGDCEDFALACRARLRSLAIPNRLVYCRIWTGEPHLVCEVDGWILNNLHRYPVRRDDLDWQWVAISGYDQGSPWSVIAT